jgi:signal transduction histidine kinase
VNEAYARACKRDITDFPGHNHFEFYPHKENKEIFNNVVKTKKPYQAMTKPFSFPDHPEWGITFWDWTLVPILDKTGEVDFLVFSLKDVTEQKRKEDLLRESGELLRRLSSELITAQEIERKRISRELHDELGQALSLIKLRLGYIEEHLEETQGLLKVNCTDTIDFIDKTIEDVRRLSHDLSPAILEDLGLASAVGRLVQGLNEIERTVHIDYTMTDVDHLIPKEFHMNIYRIIQEALTNILKHAEARNISIVTEQKDGEVIISITDDGRGFDVQRAMTMITVEKGLGLASMQERIHMIGGTMDIESQQGKGTRLSLHIPAIILA